MATEQESNHHEISLTSGMANSNDYFPDVGGATLGQYQENTSTATSKQLLPSAPLLGGEVAVVYCNGCYNLSHMN